MFTAGFLPTGPLRAVLTMLALPPVPWLALALLGAWALRGGRRGGLPAVLLAVAGLWLSACEGSAVWIEHHLLRAPPALGPAERAALRARQARKGDVAIVVLGGGVQPEAPEYGEPTLSPRALERLRYGLWLGRQTGVPVAVSGGLGPLQQGEAARTEAEVAARVAATQFGQPLRWQEAASSDTHQNARRSLALLAPQGIHEIVVVTHGWHMTRALREFRAAARHAATPVDIVPAPIGTAPTSRRALLEWTPSGEGMERTRAAWRDLLGTWVTRPD